MRVLRILPCAVLAAACSGGGGSGDGTHAQKFDSLVLFDPVPTIATDSAIVPFPFDGLFAGFSDPTLNIPNGPADDAVSFVTAANELDGFSTVADAFFDVAGRLDFGTIPAHLLIVNGSSGTPLVYGDDFVVRPQNAAAPDPLTGELVPVSEQRSRVLIEWLKPLAPSTTYVVALTRGVSTLDGAGIVPSAEFQVAASATPVKDQRSTTLDQLDEGQKAKLELLRTQAIRPVVEKLAAFGVMPEQLALAYSFTTQSVGLSLAALARTASAGTVFVQNTGVTTTTAVGVPGADVYAGVARLPYYLGNSGGDPHSTAPVTSFWQADPTQPNLDPADPAHKPAFLGQVPCAAFAVGATINGQIAHPSRSTTLCYPVPVKRSDETVPMLVSVPNVDSGRTRPPGGWPVAIFQHGITGNRTQMLAIASTLARAGFVTVAIDLPLHGLTDAGSPFYRNQLFAGTPAAPLVTGERSFDLDLANNFTGAAGPDGSIDASGTWFINLASTLTSRDNLRQASADLLTLAKSVVNLDLDHDGSPDVDATQLRFVGLSLGSIVGIPFLANSTDVTAATLAVPGGGIAKLLDASKGFGPRIALGLAAEGAAQGTDDYETFLRFAQMATDDGDALNYAAAARALHPIHLIEVVGGGTLGDGTPSPADGVVPNGAHSTCPSPLPAGIATLDALIAACAGSASSDVVINGSDLAGTDPLVAAMNLAVHEPADIPIAAPLVLFDLEGVHAVVRFRRGSHGSLLDPSASSAATAEMQRETANFLATNGACLPLGGNCAAP